MRAFLFSGFLLSVGLIAGVMWSRPTPAVATTVVKDGTRVGYVDLFAMDKRYRKMFALVTEVRKRQGELGQKLNALKQDVDRKKAQHDQAPPDRKASTQESHVSAQRAFEDAEREAKQEFETAWVDYLKACHRDCYPVLKELAEAKQIDVVHGYPVPVDEAGVTGKEKSVIEWFFRSPNVNVMYMSKGVDLTEELLEKLNAKYDAELRAKVGD